MIEYRRVSKTYSSGGSAVTDFSLTVPTATVTVFVGPSGCGKTTLLRMVNRMVEPSSGSVVIDDEDVRGREPVELRRRIGYVLQSGGLLPHRTVVENIETGLRLAGRPKNESRARALEMMALVGLAEELATRYPRQLSGGQQQRVGVARALAIEPNILLLDEPFGALDPVIRRELQQELLALQSRLNKTVIFVTHDIDEAFTLADQLVILQEGGRIAQVGTPSEILRAPANDFVKEFVGHTSATRRLHRSPEDPGLLLDEGGRIQGRLD
jgi:osmoprotectant transport system ATP-binding protein